MTPLTLRGRTFSWGQRTYLMGILNVTPDSFSDGGEFSSLEAAVGQAERLVEGGAHILDVGGQSTRPGSETISLTEELLRTIPILEALRAKFSLPISIDTTRAAVACAAVAAGADAINDISGGTFDPQMLPAAAQLGVPIVLMHLRGTPQTMQQLTDYGDLMGEIYHFLAKQVNRALEVGIEQKNLIIDPGIGFAKTYEQNLQLLRRLPELRQLGVPILVGPSRKSFIGKILQQRDPKLRVWGTAAACCAAIAGGADILRVHDLPQMRDVCQVGDAIWRFPITPDHLTGF